MDKKTLVWFRNDLRLNDNPAWSIACEQGEFIALYIKHDIKDTSYNMGAASRWWLHYAFEDLNIQLNNNLCIESGGPLEILNAYIKKTS